MPKTKQTQQPLEQLRQIRIEKLDKIRKLGFDPFIPALSLDRKLISSVREQKLDTEHAIAGRITKIRSFGKLSFIDLEDVSGKLQLAIRKENLSKKEYKLYELLDSGDFIETQGTLFKTKTDELTLEVQALNILTKSIRPLPSRYFGLKDQELRFRQRYVDFTLKPELRELFRKKTMFWNSMRQFLFSRGFLEVETPVLENTAGGADANPFVTHHNALDIDVYLRISMGELWQKRLMVGGFEKTFEIGRQFRNEGISSEHLQDYTQMEFYWAYANYKNSIDLVEEMYKHVIEDTFNTLQFQTKEHKIDLNQKWEKIDYTKTLKEKLDLDISTVSETEVQAKLSELKIPFTDSDRKARLIDLLWKHFRQNISGPAFLVGHPIEVSPLAKSIPENPKLVQRFQVIIAGSELGNGYSELNDPIDQAKRFTEQQNLRDAGDEQAQMYDHDFVRALEYGMPPVTGFGVSERLFAVLANKSIRECVMFPLLRPEENIDSIQVE